jgi:hypothetical protein
MRAPLATVLATQWIHDRTAQRLLAGVRAETGARRQLATQALGNGATNRCMTREGTFFTLGVLAN